MLLFNGNRKTHASSAQPTVTEPPPFPANLVARPASDIIQRDFRHLLWTTADGVELKAPVEVVVRTHLERTAGEYVLGDLVYTLSLLPGEQVQMFSTDRRTQFSIDSQTNIGFHTAATFEDHMYLSSMDSFFGQLNASQWAHADAGTSGSFKSHGEASGAFESFFSGPDADMNGSFNTNSSPISSAACRRTASAAHHMSATATNTASAVSVGAVGIRNNIEGKVDTHVEMDYRSFRNPSRTRAITSTFANPAHAPGSFLGGLHQRLGARAHHVSPAPTTGRGNGYFHTGGGGSSNLPIFDQLPPTSAPRMPSSRKSWSINSCSPRQWRPMRCPTPFVRKPPSIASSRWRRRASTSAARDVGVVADPSLFREVTNIGSVIADEVEGLAISFVERLGAGIVPVVANTVAAAQALIWGRPRLHL